MGFRAPWGALFLSILVLVHCRAWGERTGGGAGENKPLETMGLVLEKSGGGEVPIKAELARTDEERARGLMYRSSLPDGEGMLFIFEREQILSFWMKNTRIPLSIAYISASGRIIEIWDMKPQDLSSVVSSRSVRYALEVPQGWFNRTGIVPGDYLRLPW